jgi:hypothetical protein
MQKGTAVRKIKWLYRENKRLRTAIETAVGACSCRQIEPCEGCESLRMWWKLEGAEPGEED